MSYRKWFYEGVFGDAAYHYCIVRALSRKNGNYEGVPEFLLRNGPDRYPIIFHRFASLFNLQLIEKFPFLPNFLIFIVFTAFIPILISLLSISEDLELVNLTTMSSQSYLAILTGFLFITSVANNSMFGHGILFLSLSERLLAKLSVALYFFGAFQWLNGENSIFLLVSIAAGYLALSSSMFARQALLFISLIWALFKLDATVLFPLAGAIFLSTVIDGKFFILGLFDQWDFSTSYRTYTAKSRVFIDSLSKFSSFHRSESIRSMVRQFWVEEPGKSFFRHSDLIIVLIIGWQHLSTSLLELFLAIIVVYFLCTTKTYRHLGESERYLDYSLALILPYLLALEIMLQPTIEMAAAIFMIAIAYRAIFIAYSFWKDAGRTVIGNNSLDDLLLQAKISKNSRVLPLPINLGQAISARTNCSVICYPGVYGNWIFERYIDEYPLIKRPLDKIISEFNITHIVVHKVQAQYFSTVVGWSYDFSKYKEISENEYWICYSIS